MAKFVNGISPFWLMASTIVKYHTLINNKNSQLFQISTPRAQLVLRGEMVAYPYSHGAKNHVYLLTKCFCNPHGRRRFAKPEFMNHHFTDESKY